jgi:hypothetical protein
MSAISREPGTAAVFYRGWAPRATVDGRAQGRMASCRQPPRGFCLARIASTPVRQTVRPQLIFGGFDGLSNQRPFLFGENCVNEVG